MSTQCSFVNQKIHCKPFRCHFPISAKTESWGIFCDKHTRQQKKYKDKVMCVNAINKILYSCGFDNKDDNKNNNNKSNKSKRDEKIFRDFKKRKKTKFNNTRGNMDGKEDDSRNKSDRSNSDNTSAILLEAIKFLSLPIKYNVEQVKINYKRKAFEVHPDKNLDNESYANEMMKKLNRLRDILLMNIKCDKC